MAIIPVTLRKIGALLYAVPEDISLADYTTERRVLTPVVTPNEGRYTFNTGSSTALVWRIFEGSSTPANWAEALPEVIDLTDLTSIVSTAVEEALVGIGVVPTLVISPGVLKQTGRNFGTTMDFYEGETGNFTTFLFDDALKALNLSGGPWTFYVADKEGTAVFNASLTVSGAEFNQITFALGTLCNSVKYDHVWAIRNTASKLLKSKGKLNVRPAPGA